MNIEQMVAKKWFRYLLVLLFILLIVSPGLTDLAKGQPFPAGMTLLNLIEAIVCFCIGYLMARSH